MINRYRNHRKCSIGTALTPCLTLFQAKLFESRAELELLINFNVWYYVKHEFVKITKEVSIFIRKAKHIRRYNYTIEQNLWRTDTANRRGGSEWEPIKILLEGDGDSNKTNTAFNTRLRLTTQVGQAHATTEVLLDLGTNKQLSKPKQPTRTAKTCTACCLCCTGQTDGLRRSDRWTEPVRPVATTATQQAFHKA
jgi:hypothetical protein